MTQNSAGGDVYLCVPFTGGVMDSGHVPPSLVARRRQIVVCFRRLSTTPGYEASTRRASETKV